MYKEYELNARVVERNFRRKLNKRGYFRTAKGAINYLVAYEKDCIYLKSVKGKYEDGRKIYLENGERIKAPEDMTTTEIIIQNLKFLLSLENLFENKRLSFDSLIDRGV